MDRNRTPAAGQVYRSPSGLPAFFVRTESRGAQGAGHLFAETRDRAVFTRWLPVGDGLPDDLELVFDPGATERAEELEGQLAKTHAERKALAEALRAAVEVVPVAVANDLRRRYSEALKRHYADGRS